MRYAKTVKSALTFPVLTANMQFFRVFTVDVILIIAALKNPMCHSIKTLRKSRQILIET